MAEFHFVEDYERLVDHLISHHPIDAAMEMAVGGSYDAIGQIEVDILRHAGLRDGMDLLDMGCGSGRLAHALGKSGMQLNYTGVDIIGPLLDYAKTKSPGNYSFVLNRALSVPAAAGSQDMICGFSLFTHLLHHETYIYMTDMRRALKDGGKLVFSFLEFGAKGHWPTFENTVEAALQKTTPHLNSFIERSAIEVWARRLGFSTDEFIDSTESVSIGPLGQTTAILRKF